MALKPEFSGRIPVIATDVRGIDLNAFLLRVFAAALGRNIGDCAFQQLQQRLLNPFAGDIARDRRAVALARDLVDLIDVDNARFGARRVEVRRLQELQDDILHIIPHVPRLGQRGGIHHGKRHIQHLRKRLGQQGFPAPRRADQEHIRLVKLDPVNLPARQDPLVVIVNRDRENPFRALLAYRVLIEVTEDLVRTRDFQTARDALAGAVFGDDFGAELNAFIADIDFRPGNEFAHFVVAFAAKRATGDITSRAMWSHKYLPWR